MVEGGRALCLDDGTRPPGPAMAMSGLDWLREKASVALALTPALMA